MTIPAWLCIPFAGLLLCVAIMPLVKAELWEAIDQFPGSVILVTHEDNFYEGLVDIVLNFELEK